MPETASVYFAVKPTFFMTKLIGLVPFKFYLGTNRKMYADVAWSFIVLSVLSTCAIYAVYINSTTIPDQNGVITEISNVLVEYLSILNLNVCILCAFFRGKKITNILAEISKIDAEFAKLNVTREIVRTYRYLRRYQLVGALVVNSFICVIYTLEVIIALHSEQIFSFGNIFCHDVPIMMSLYVDLQLFVLLFSLKQRYQILNGVIGTFCARINAMDFFEAPTKVNYCNMEALEGTLTRMRMVHLHISNTCDEINEAYSPQLLTMTLQAFISLIANMFYWARELIAGQVSLTTESIFYSCSILFFGVGQLIFIVVLCSQTASEATKVGYLLHRVASYPYKLDVQVSHFTSQLTHCKVEFTACKIFELNEGLLLGVVGAITTYLIIVIQFELTTKQI